jgi:STE24 endopeptidase
MFLMKASEKTNGLNAYVNGIGATKRIVVWDTTAGRIPDDEVMFIFGHESGHYVLNHIPKMMVWPFRPWALFFHLLGLRWICRLAGAALWRAGACRPATRRRPLATRAGFVVLILAVTIAGFVLEPVTNTISRHFEHQADVYGQEAIHGLFPTRRRPPWPAFRRWARRGLKTPTQPAGRILGVQPPQREDARQLRRAVRSVGQWRKGRVF